MIFDFSPTVQMVLLVERYRSTVIMYYDKGDPDQGVTGQYQFTKLRLAAGSASGPGNRSTTLTVPGAERP